MVSDIKEDTNLMIKKEMDSYAFIRSVYGYFLKLLTYQKLGRTMKTMMQKLCTEH